MLTNLTVPSSRAFSLERPTRNDFDLWRHALQQILSSQYTLERGLGDYLIARVPVVQFDAIQDPRGPPDRNRSLQSRRIHGIGRRWPEVKALRGLPVPGPA